MTVEGLKFAAFLAGATVMNIVDGITGKAKLRDDLNATKRDLKRATRSAGYWEGQAHAIEKARQKLETERFYRASADLEALDLVDAIYRKRSREPYRAKALDLLERRGRHVR